MKYTGRTTKLFGGLLAWFVGFSVILFGLVVVKRGLGGIADPPETPFFLILNGFRWGLLALLFMVWVSWVYASYSNMNRDWKTDPRFAQSKGQPFFHPKWAMVSVLVPGISLILAPGALASLYKYTTGKDRVAGKGGMGGRLAYEHFRLQWWMFWVILLMELPPATAFMIRNVGFLWAGLFYVFSFLVGIGIGANQWRLMQEQDGFWKGKWIPQPVAEEVKRVEGKTEKEATPGPDHHYFDI